MTSTASTWGSATRSDVHKRARGFAAAAAAISLFVSSLVAADEPAGEGRYLGTQEFLEIAFEENPPEPDTIWMTKDHREPVEQLLGHPFGSLRVRYWRDGIRTAWILDEIGKELPITIGVVVDDGAIREIRVLEFREIRGWEVRYPFFTDQFRGARLTGDGELDTHIDGITGATLSVGAVKRVARAALYLHEQVLDE